MNFQKKEKKVRKKFGYLKNHAYICISINLLLWQIL